MVPRSDNDTINKLSQSHNNSPKVLTPAETLAALLEYHDQAIRDFRRNQIDVNAFGDDPASGVISIENPTRDPILITDIYATWAIPPSTSSLGSKGSVTAPAATASIDTTGALTGTYNYEVTVYVDGTFTSADEDNMEIVFGANTITIAYPVSGTSGPGIPITYTGTAVLNANTFAVKAIAAGGAAAVYHAQITLTKQAAIGTATITFGGRTLELPYAAGVFNLTSLHGLQWDYNGAAGNSMVLTVSPASAAHLEMAGMADRRKIDKQ